MNMYEGGMLNSMTHKQGKLRVGKSHNQMEMIHDMLSM